MGIFDISQLVSVPQEEQIARAYLQPIDLAPGEVPPWGTDERPPPGRTSARWAVAFQYWPASVQDTHPSGWKGRPIPGGSHPVREWDNGGDRQISFVAVFGTDSSPPFETDLERSGVDLGGHDMDIRVGISWLRWFTAPHYGSDRQSQEAHPPPKALLVLPGMKLGHTGTDYVRVTVDQCDVTYMESFSNGVPKIAEVSLAFSESVVSSEVARFHDRADFGPAADVLRYLSAPDIGVASVGSSAPSSGVRGIAP